MAAMPVTEMAAYEDDDTRLEFNMEYDLPRYRTDQISQYITKLWSSILLLSIKRCVCFVHSETAVRILSLMTKKP